MLNRIIVKLSEANYFYFLRQAGFIWFLYVGGICDE